MTGAREVPAELRRLWGVSTDQRLGRPAELDAATVVRAAAMLADRHGLSGASLPKVAKELGVTAMSLYRHVGSKDELLTLMADYGLGTPPHYESDAGRWREALWHWACTLSQVYRRRPWIGRIPASGPPAGPNGIGWLDAALVILRDTGLDWTAKVAAVSLVSGYARFASMQSLDLQHGRERAGTSQLQAERDYGESLMALVEPERFPEAASLFASGLFGTEASPRSDDPADDADFTRGLDLVLDGIATAIAAAR